MYAVAAGIQDAEVLSIPLNDDFQPDIAALRRHFPDPKNKLLFLCSPNNPTGNLMDRAAVELILGEFPGLVVLDEAYIDFAEHGSFLPRLREFPNLVVLQTFSKAWGMAGLRLGMAFAAPEIIAVLNKIKAPYNLNRFTQDYMLEAVANVAEMEARRNELVRQRDALRKRLRENSLTEHIYHSDANFLLVRFSNPRLIFQSLLDQGIIVRDRGAVVANTLRITIGTPAENEILLAELQRLSHLLTESKA
jgi:histidinol-phosphate aminotransferase